MKKTQVGSPDGIKVINYIAGEQYDLPDDLADVFVKQMKIAEPAGSPEAQEEKMVTPPENKAEQPEKDKKDKKEKKDKKDKDNNEEDPF